MSRSLDWQIRNRPVHARRTAAIVAGVFLLALLFPLRFQTGSMFLGSISLLEVAVLALFIFLFPLVVWRGSLWVGDGLLTGLLVIPWLFACLSWAWSLDSDQTLKWAVIYALPLISYVVVVNHFNVLSSNFILKSLVIAVWVLIFSSIISYIPGSPLAPEIIYEKWLEDEAGFYRGYRQRFSHPFLGLSNNFAAVLVMLLPFVVLSQKLGVWPRLSLWAGVLIVLSVFATGSRGAILALVLVGALIVFTEAIRHGRIRKKLMIGTGLGVVLVVSVLVMVWGLSAHLPPHFKNRVSVGGLEARLDAWRSIGGVLLEYPFGVGAGISLSSVSEVGLQSVHNAYLQNLLWYGVFGGFLVSVAMVALPWAAFRLRVLTPQAEMAKKALAFSVLLLMVVNLSQASWETPIVRLWAYTVVGLGLVLVRRLSVEKGEGAARRST